jgi:hypothetical protein
MIQLLEPGIRRLERCKSGLESGRTLSKFETQEEPRVFAERSARWQKYGNEIGKWLGFQDLFELAWSYQVRVASYFFTAGLSTSRLQKFDILRPCSKSGRLRYVNSTSLPVKIIRLTA